MGSRLSINGSPLPQSSIAPTISLSSFIADVIITVTAGTTVSLELFGLLGTATLVAGAGATLTIIRVS